MVTYTAYSHYLDIAYLETSGYLDICPWSRRICLYKSIILLLITRYLFMEGKQYQFDFFSEQRLDLTICLSRTPHISIYFAQSRGYRDNESELYIYNILNT